MKKIFTFFLALAASAGTMRADIFNGTCGDNLTWSLNTQDSILTIEGSGEMTSNPWSDYKSYIKYASLPDGLTNIGEYAFQNCSSMVSVEIPNSVTSIGRVAFNNCSVLASIEIPNSVISIGKSAFYGCSSLASIEIPNSVTSIGERAFGACSSVTFVTIGSSVASIGHDAFGSVLTSIVVAEDNQFFSSADGVLFDKNKTIIIQCPVGKMGLYTIPNTVTSIRDRAFNGSKLTSITIPNSVISIGTQTFAYCMSLTSVTLGNSVTSIGPNAFQNCHHLASIEIPNSVTSIGGSAFTFCIRLTSIDIPSSVISIGGPMCRECPSLTSINVANDNPSYSSKDGVLFDKDIKTLIEYPEGNARNSYRIPNTVTSIGRSAFYGCGILTSVEIPNSVINIEKSAFMGCSSLTSVTIPNSVTSIGERAFNSCSGLTSVTCESTTPPDIGSNAFSKKSIPLYVPAESVDAYKAADQWKDFNVQAITGIEPAPETEEVNCNIRYVDKDVAFVSSEQLTFNVPEAPAFDGFTFLRWEFVGGPMSDGLTIQAVYQANPTTSAPAVVTNPANPAQKLIREGNVYILRGDKVYTLQGQEVR